MPRSKAEGQTIAAIIGAVGAIMAACGGPWVVQWVRHFPSNEAMVTILGNVEDSCTGQNIVNAEIVFLGKNFYIASNGHFDSMFPHDKV